MAGNPTVDRGKRFASAYIGLVATAGAAVLALSLRNILRGEHGLSLAAWVAVALLTVIVGRLALRLPLRCSVVSFSDVFIFLSVILFGTDCATLTGALDGYAASSASNGTWVKRAFNTAAMAVSVNLSSRLFQRMTVADGTSGDPMVPPLRFVPPLVLLLVTQCVLNTVLVAGVIALREGVTFGRVWTEAFPWSGTACLAGSVASGIAFLVSFEAGAAGFITLLPFPAILYFAYRVTLDWFAEAKASSRG